MLRNPHCLDSPLIDGGEVVGFTHRTRSVRQKLSISASDTRFTASLV
jgi:hypothetical protein